MDFHAPAVAYNTLIQTQVVKSKLRFPRIQNRPRAAGHAQYYDGVDIDGTPLPNGSSVKASSEACLEACQLDQSCIGWSYCGKASRCSRKLGECVLKRIPDITRMTLASAGPGMNCMLSALDQSSDYENVEQL